MKVWRELGLPLLVAVAALAAFLAALHALGVEDALLAFLARIEAAGLAGALAFALLVAATVPALVPSVLLTLGAGALYGVVVGTLLIVTAETIGAVLAFLAGRRLLGPRAAAALTRRARLRSVIDGIDAHDWRFVALLRMIPFFPFKIANYALGLTPLTVGRYAFGTWIGLVPIALFNVHLGAIGGELLMLGRDASAGEPIDTWLKVVALLFTAGVTVLAARQAMRLVAASTAVASRPSGGAER